MIHRVSLYGVVWTRFWREWGLLEARVNAGGIGVSAGSALYRIQWACRGQIDWNWPDITSV